MKRCETCAGSLEGRRSDARYCSDVCRARAKQGYRAPTVDEAAASVESDSSDGQLMSLEDVARELQRSLRAPLTPATAKAALAREYLATLEKIQALMPAAKDEVDELLERRIHRG